MDLASVQAAVEAAASALENSNTRQEAERVLLEFRASPSPFAACQHILAHSTQLGAQFQAVLTLRESALRSWGELEKEQRMAITRFALDQALHRAGDSAVLVRAQCILTATQLAKRSHADPGQGSLSLPSLVHGVADRAVSSESLDEQRTCLDLLAALTSECNPQTASPMEQPWSWHDKARQVFEREALSTVALCALRAGAASAPAVASESDRGVCTAALGVLCTVLGWDFRSGREALMLQVSSQLGDRPGEDDGRRGPKRLSPEVHALLSAPGALDWAAQLGPTLSGPARCDSDAARALRRLALHMAQSSGPLAPGAPSDPASAYGPWALRLAFGSWVWPAKQALGRAAAGADEEFLDGCRVVAAAAAVAGPAAWAGPAAAGTGGGPGLAALGDLTLAVLEAMGSNPHRDEWLGEAARTLMDAWAALSGRLEGVGGGAAAAAAVHEAGLVHGLAVAAAEACEDEDDAGAQAEAAVLEHEVSCLAAVGRGGGASTLLSTSHALSTIRGQLAAAAGSGSDPSVPLEQLCWLLTAGAALLADEPGEEGDDPQPPAGWSESGAAEGVAALSMQLLAVAQLCASHAGHTAISPRLLEVTCESLGRWAGTYFFSDVSLPPSLVAPDADVAQLLVQLARAALGAYPGETMLHKKASRLLLLRLPRRTAAAAALLRCDGWLALCADVAAGRIHVNADAARPLLHALCSAARGDDAAGAATYVRHLVQPSAERLRELAAETRRDVLWRADVTPRVLLWLESVRGSVQSASPATLPALLETAQLLADPLSTLLEAYRGNSEVTTALLKLAAAVGEDLLPLITQAQLANQLSQWGLGLMGNYSRHVQNVLDVSLRHRESYRDVRAFLKLLAAMARSGGAEAGPAAEMELVQVVAEGLQAVIPLLPTDLPSYPKLCHAFFDIIAFMLESFPGSMAVLPPPVWGGLVGTLFHGLGMAGGGPELTQVVLEALTALATFHVKSVMSGGAGVSASNIPGPGTHVGGRECREWAGTLTPLGALLARLLHRLVFEERGADVLVAASPTLLPLVIAEPAVVHALRAELLLNIKDPALQSSVSSACDLLVADPPKALDPRVKARFLTKLQNFAEVVRSAARYK